jgi:adenylylsulfate kinase-like enzyme
MSNEMAAHETPGSVPARANISWHAGRVTAAHRHRYVGHKVATIRPTALSRAGESTLDIANFTGIPAPYERPEPPASAIDSGAMPHVDATRALYDHPTRRLR